MRSIHGPSEGTGTSNVDTSNLATKTELASGLANETDLSVFNNSVGNLQTQITNLQTIVNSIVVATNVPPVAFFSQDKVSGPNPMTVSFIDQSTNNPTSWLWNFGDGTTSTQQNPTKVYPNAGTYTVTLTATNAHGSDSKVSNNLINVTPSSLAIDYLVVGGGGGVIMCEYQAPAGGGGEVLTGSTTINAGTPLIATVGAGGAAGTFNGDPGKDGTASSFGSVTARGGQGSKTKAGNSGSSGNGNVGYGDATWAQGGAGGAGGPGIPPSGYKGSSGAGGPGVQWSANSQYYGGGGGGAGYNGGVGAGGVGGGGTGQSINGNSSNPGTTNTGGGAGGRAGDAYVAYKGSAGGSGIIIVRYAGTPKLTGGTITQNGGYTYHTFTSSGILTL